MNSRSSVMEEERNVSESMLNCPQFTAAEYELSEFFTFWIEGVLSCVVATPGLIANVVSAIILTKEDMRNSFNFLLIALICMDSCYLLSYTAETLRKCFDLATDLHLSLFPYFLYPSLSIAMTGSVFMTVAIALERYIAVHYPIDYSQAINSPTACRQRLFKYVVPVVILSVVINIPKFFESELFELEVPIVLQEDDNITMMGVHLVKAVRVTELRKDPDYTIYYNNWTRFILLGIAPMALLIYFNYKIYQDVKHRNRRQMSRARTTATATATQHARRKQEDNLAIVFMGIVIVFLFCHAPRLCLSMYEMLVIREAMACERANHRPFPLWALNTMCVSHMLLVVNSSTNLMPYICLNKAFRAHFVAIFKGAANTIATRCCKRVGAGAVGGAGGGGGGVDHDIRDVHGECDHQQHREHLLPTSTIVLTESKEHVLDNQEAEMTEV